MLCKVLAIVSGAVFVGAAAAEISGYLTRRRDDDLPSQPRATDEDGEGDEEQGQTVNPAEG